MFSACAVDDIVPWDVQGKSDVSRVQDPYQRRL
jgi:hypothetical protein